jgi:hypothetical protein
MPALEEKDIVKNKKVNVNLGKQMPRNAVLTGKTLPVDDGLLVGIYWEGYRKKEVQWVDINKVTNHMKESANRSLHSTDGQRGGGGSTSSSSRGSAATTMSIGGDRGRATTAPITTPATQTKVAVKQKSNISHSNNNINTRTFKPSHGKNFAVLCARFRDRLGL